jgi:hypothetical protein
MNLNNCGSSMWCPEFFANKGAVFMPFSSRVGVEALKSVDPRLPGDWYFYDHVYKSLGDDLVGDTAVLPEKPTLPFRETVVGEVGRPTPGPPMK